VPFEVLPWGGERLVDRFDVFAAPSLQALGALLEGEAAAATPRVLAVGDAVENLPGARVEAGRVAALFPERTVLLGAQAVETAVRGAMAAADVVHLAVHGIEPTSGRPAWLELLPDSANDGRLFADEIAALRLRSTLVTLSACDSGVGAPNPGDEIPGVLDRAFLQAGARTVISSRWPVSDAATLRFMETFYGALAERGRLGAFAEAQRALRSGRVSGDGLEAGALAVRGVRRPADDGRPADFTHPYFWASFALKGDPR
jgi:CHAT domain-containing protein